MRKQSCFAVILLLALALPSILAGWVEDGVLITYASYDQDYPQIAYSGDGCAIIVWEDDRSFPTQGKNIYAQRVDTAGTIYWVFNGMPVCRADGPQHTPLICPDGAGGAYICWEDERNEDMGIDLYIQRIGSDGMPLWDLNGIPVTTDTLYQHEAQILPDGSGGVIVVWTDGRGMESTAYDIYAQRFDSDGNTLWGGSGVPVCDYPSSQYGPAAVPDGEGGVFVVWRDGRLGGYPTYNSNNLFMARLDADGLKQYEESLIVQDADQIDPAIVPVGDGSYIVAWRDSRASLDWDLYAQRVTRGGMKLWSEDGLLICDADGTQYVPVGVSDGAGEAIFVWHDNRNVTSDIYASLVDSSAAQPWGVNGAPVCTEDGYQVFPRIVSDNTGGAVICWEDRRAGYDVYAQRIDHDGGSLWASGGLAVCDETNDQYNPVLCTDGGNGALIAWMDLRIGNFDIYASLVTGGGDLVATMLESSLAEIDGSRIVLSWTLSDMDEGVRFIVSRSSAPVWLYEPVAEPAIAGDGMFFTFFDESVEQGGEYRYIVEAETGYARVFLFETEILSVPAAALALYQNHPNPFNPSTTIRYYLPEGGPVILDVFDVSGRLVRRLIDGETQEAGPNSTIWNGYDGNGDRVESGMYFYRLTAGKRSLSRKMLLLR